MLKTFVLCLAVLLAACGAKPSPEPFPAPASTASSEDPAVAPSRRRSAGYPVPVVPAGPGGAGACADRPYGQGIHGAAFVDGIGPRAGAEPCVCPELESGRAGRRTQRNPDHMGRSGCVSGKAESDTAAARRPARTVGEGFQWLSVAPEVKFTGYYSPVMQASRTRKPGYEYPIYRLPGGACPGAGVVPAYAQLPRGRLFAGDQAGRPVLQPGGHRSGRSAQEPESGNGVAGASGGDVRSDAGRFRHSGL